MNLERLHALLRRAADPANKYESVSAASLADSLAHRLGNVLYVVPAGTPVRYCLVGSHVPRELVTPQQAVFREADRIRSVDAVVAGRLAFSSGRFIFLVPIAALTLL